MQGKDTERADYSSGCKSARTVSLWILFCLKTKIIFTLFCQICQWLLLLSRGTYIHVWAMFQASSLGEFEWHLFDNINKLFWIWLLKPGAVCHCNWNLVHSSCTQMAGKKVKDTGSPTEMQDSPPCVWNHDKTKAKFICSQDLDRNHSWAVLGWPCPGM